MQRVEFEPDNNWQPATWYVADGEHKATIVCPDCEALNLGDEVLF